MATATWKDLNVSLPDSLAKVAFVNACSGLAVGLSGTILTTTDGGTLWTQRNLGTTTVPPVTRVQLRDVAAIGPNYAWAVGDNHIADGTIVGHHREYRQRRRHLYCPRLGQP